MTGGNGAGNSGFGGTFVNNQLPEGAGIDNAVGFSAEFLNNAVNMLRAVGNELGQKFAASGLKPDIGTEVSQNGGSRLVIVSFSFFCRLSDIFGDRGSDDDFKSGSFCPKARCRFVNIAADNRLFVKIRR